MSDQVIEQEVQSQSDDEALASAMAGYNKARGDEPPAEVAPEPPQESVVTAVEERPEPEQKAAPEPSVADELAALKAKVRAMESTGDADAVRRLHGEIGNINRTLKQLQSPKVESAPVDDELTAALKEAEAAAQDFPELVGPNLL